MAAQGERYTTEELMAVALSRELRDGDVCFIGIGTGGRAFILSVGIPLVACRLAQYSHAPNLIPMLGPLIDPNLDKVPSALSRDYEIVHWPSRAQIPEQEALDVFKCGKMDVGFISGAQVDRYGNVNIVCIGDYEKPTVRLVGPLAQTDHCAFAKRTLITLDHQRRSFVERVDFISGAGFLDGGDARRRAGLPGGGPAKVVTNLAILDFEPASKRMRIHSVHPGISADEVQANTGFALVVPPEVPATPAPTSEQVRLIRGRFDPEGLFLKARRPACDPSS